jgi:hypothetical protein
VHQRSSTPTDFEASLTAIRDELLAEHDARVGLAQKMKQEIERLYAASATVSAAKQATGSGVQRPAEPSDASLESTSDPSGELESELAETWFSESALLDSGIPAEEVRRLRKVFDDAELEKRYLRDYAIREGWITSSRYTDALREIRQELHTSLGDEDYDKVLFATGRSNRVRVSDALQGSAATAAGIRSGDVIIRYAGNRVFDPNALYVWSTEGKADAPTEVEVLRNGEIIHLFIPRGPLGTRFNHERVAPTS